LPIYLNYIKVKPTQSMLPSINWSRSCN